MNIRILFLLLFLSPNILSNSNDDLGPARYVNPFIGTDAHGHTYSGAAVPFGAVQLSPATRLTGWDGCSGYHYSDSVMYGFAHTALSGTGVSDYGDVLLMPVVGPPVFSNTEYASAFRKEEEYAEAGYYRVFLDKPGVLAEMTVSPRTGFHRYTFPDSRQSHIIIDLEHRDLVLESWIEFVGDSEVRGMRRSKNWAEDHVVYFHMKFSKPFSDQGITVNKNLIEDTSAAHGENIIAFVEFHTEQDEHILVKVGISAVSTEGALRNLEAEVPHWDFDKTREEARQSWNDILGKIEVGGGTDEQLITFYTALYHAFLQPYLYMDVDGAYRGADFNIHTADEFTNYTVFSLWDTYRTWHPLMTIIDTRRTNDFIRIFLDQYEKRGLLPVWELAANETFCMIGYHSVSVIADAWVKGIRDYDGALALEAMLHSANQNHFGLYAYRTYGHIPGDKEHESISKTLEYAYDDWCIAQMAKSLEREDIYAEYIRRAQYYKNIFDSSTGFMRPKMNGNWITPFDPTRVDWHFTEANSWQYSFYVPQDIGGLIEAHGDKEKLADKIDELFETDVSISGRDMKDISGLIGQYAHGNEPSHHIAYLYNFVDQPWKTQRRVRQIMDELYTHLPDGLSGNEDCGQMSAWYIMSAMGFYPVTPGTPEYIIGTPLFPEIKINLENGKTFSVIARDVSGENIYIQSARLNGHTYTKSYLSHSDIMDGGVLEFSMGPEPNPDWGTGPGDQPVIAITDEPILQVPYFISGDHHLRTSQSVEIHSATGSPDIFYTLDGSTPTRESHRYIQPLNIDETTTIKAVTWHPEKGYSLPVEASFVKIDIDKKIQLLTPYHRSYTAGGPEGLIDNIRGPENWRLGGWQGYQSKDFEAIIDLGDVLPIQRIATGFLQDIGSWIWMPVEVSYWISNDGKEFTEVATIKNQIPDDDYAVTINDFETRVDAEARFVKVIATNYGNIPPWHPGAGGDAFIFIDEVMVEVSSD